MACRLSILAVFLLLSAMTSVSAEKVKCSITRYGDLTMFSGEKGKVEVPCKYRLANFNCGDYEIKVTPGSSLDGDRKSRENRFTPDTVWVHVTHLFNGSQWVGRTASSLVDKHFEDLNSPAWHDREGDLQFDVSDLHPHWHSAVLEQPHVFRVTFSRGGPDDGVTVTCASSHADLKPGAYPVSLCGDGSSQEILPDRRRQLFGSFECSRDLTIVHDVLDNADVTQCERCQNLTTHFQHCQPDKRAQASRLCGPLFTRRPFVFCSIRDIDDLTPFDDCATAVCHGNQEACLRFKRSVKQNCGEQQLDEFAELEC